MGRTGFDHTPEMVEDRVMELCEYLEANQHVQVHKACNHLGIPRTLLYHWVDSGKVTQNLIDRLNVCRANVIERIILEMDSVADGSYRDGRDSRRKEKGANVARDKMILDHRKWLLTKLMPARFGDSFESEEEKESPEININFVNR